MSREEKKNLKLEKNQIKLADIYDKKTKSVTQIKSKFSNFFENKLFCRLMHNKKENLWNELHRLDNKRINYLVNDKILNKDMQAIEYITKNIQNDCDQQLVNDRDIKKRTKSIKVFKLMQKKLKKNRLNSLEQKNYNSMRKYLNNSKSERINDIIFQNKLKKKNFKPVLQKSMSQPENFVIPKNNEIDHEKYTERQIPDKIELINECNQDKLKDKNHDKSPSHKIHNNYFKDEYQNENSPDNFKSIKSNYISDKSFNNLSNKVINKKINSIKMSPNLFKNSSISNLSQKNFLHKYKKSPEPFYPEFKNLIINQTLKVFIQYSLHLIHRFRLIIYFLLQKSFKNLLQLI